MRPPPLYATLPMHAQLDDVRTTYMNIEISSCCKVWLAPIIKYYLVLGRGMTGSRDKIIADSAIKSLWCFPYIFSKLVPQK